jgi:hypothetical protein
LAEAIASLDPSRVTLAVPAVACKSAARAHNSGSSSAAAFNRGAFAKYLYKRVRGEPDFAAEEVHDPEAMLA